MAYDKITVTNWNHVDIFFGSILGIRARRVGILKIKRSAGVKVKICLMATQF